MNTIPEPQLYYSCPIEAAYMNKNFHVQFLNTIPILLEDAISFYYTPNTYDKYYVLRESFHIFNPQNGDIITGNEGPAMVHMEKTYYPIGTKEANITQILISSAIYLCEKGDIKIIQRNNKAFITPHKE
jgi:hypothetical protein